MLFALLLAVIIGFALLAKRLTTLEQEVRRIKAELADRTYRTPPVQSMPQSHGFQNDAPPGPAIAPVPEPARAAAELAASLPEYAPPSIVPPRRGGGTPPEQRVAKAERQPFSLERLIGGSLPIWIGGAALVLAGFFLVRYSIESGLLGPTARTLLAALFALGLIGASELARNLPATRDDPRVAQALAGAGVASLYATLYLAAALYSLIGPLTAFFGVIVVTATALALSLRHGPPTAVMALVGGALAPMVAGFDAIGIGPLMVYLGLLVAALFGLAIHRGWGWLALAASAVGFLWINFLLVAHVGAGGLSSLGIFTLLLAAGASAALPATGIRQRWIRLLPLVGGLIQLLLLAPALEFGSLAWSFYLILAAAALFLAWRDPAYLPAIPTAIALLLLLESVAFLSPELRVTPLAAIVATLLFAIPGHALWQRGGAWLVGAMAGTAGPILVAHATAPTLLAPVAWGLIELGAAAAVAHLAWRLLRDRDAPALIAASALAGLLAAIGLAQFFPAAWLCVPLAAVAIGLAAWARHARAALLYELPAYPLAAALVAALYPLIELSGAILTSIVGSPLPYPQLPDAPTLMRALALPVVVTLGMLWDAQIYGKLRRWVAGVAAVVAILLLYVLAKQVLTIDTRELFRELGFIERAVLTQIALGAGWLLLRRGAYPQLGRMLVLLGVVRFIWFDLLTLNPVLMPQAVGGIPVVNAATLHAGLLAFWLWTLPPTRWMRPVAGLATLLAVLVAIRQLSHGSILVGPVQTGENLGYSAALLGVALFWLWRGITAELRDLRIAGLSLLTIVTFKVFLVDAAALDGILRILSFLGLGVALIAIGWAYNRFLGKGGSGAGDAAKLGG